MYTKGLMGRIVLGFTISVLVVDLLCVFLKTTGVWFLTFISVRKLCASEALRHSLVMALFVSLSFPVKF